MGLNSSSKEKQNFSGIKKKRISLNQNLKGNSLELKNVSKIKKSLQYLLLLKKFNNTISYKNVELLQAFLTKYGKIRPRRKTRVSAKQQRSLAKSIRKARALKVIPFTCDVKI